MNTQKELGRIESASFRFGGYQGVEFGLFFEFRGKGWGCGWSKSFWGPGQVDPDENTQWTEVDRHGEEVEIAITALNDSGKYDFNTLADMIEEQL